MPMFRSALRLLCFSAGGFALVAAVGCGTGGSTAFLNNTENFSAASLKGSYVYQLRGADALSFSPYREVGVFTADGAGKITGGSDDTSFTANAPATVTGSYQIASDGTGSITMTSQLGTINLAVTMVSSSKVYLIEADHLNSSGLGVNATGFAELQDSSAIATTPTGPFAFRIHDEVSGVSQQPAA